MKMLGFLVVSNDTWFLMLGDGDEDRLLFGFLDDLLGGFLGNQT